LQQGDGSPVAIFYACARHATCSRFADNLAAKFECISLWEGKGIWRVIVDRIEQEIGRTVFEESYRGQKWARPR